MACAGQVPLEGESVDVHCSSAGPSGAARRKAVAQMVIAIGATEFSVRVINERIVRGASGSQHLRTGSKESSANPSRIRTWFPSETARCLQQTQRL